MVVAGASTIAMVVVRVSRPINLFSNVAAPPEIYTLSLHDALPISAVREALGPGVTLRLDANGAWTFERDRKSTRLNSSHRTISYAVFCLKKKSPERPRFSCTPNTPRISPTITYPPNTNQRTKERVI